MINSSYILNYLGINNLITEFGSIDNLRDPFCLADSLRLVNLRERMRHDLVLICSTSALEYLDPLLVIATAESLVGIFGKGAAQIGRDAPYCVQYARSFMGCYC